MKFLWLWRRLHALNECRYAGSWERHDTWGIDVGYCLDRYSIEDADGNVTVSHP